MRLNWFIPFRKRRSAAPRLLGLLGPSWRASPIRRLCQAACLALFLALFFHVAWPYGPTADYAGRLAGRERIEAELFLALDPLVSLSTAIAARSWVWSLSFAAVAVGVSVLLPRMFCGYVCPFGTVIDLFDRAVTGPVRRLLGLARPRSTARRLADGPAASAHRPRRPWYRNLRYFILTGVLAAAGMGVIVTGFVAAIPVVTRGFQFLLNPLDLGVRKHWHLVPPMHAGHWLSIGLLAAVLGLGVVRPRFWCRYLCPTGAVFSAANLLRLTERKVAASCTECGQCQRICPFDAINDDYSTRPTDCTFCQACGSVCPVHAIEFAPRWTRLAGEQAATAPEPAAQTPVAPTGPLSRRGFLCGSAAGAATGLLAGWLAPQAVRAGSAAMVPVRPPGSVPEELFLRLCVRCGECFRVCPYNVLQPLGFEHGLDSLWTPAVFADWSGCEPGCNNCGQVCPTGAIRALPIEEKRVTRMALAVVCQETCLPFNGSDACQTLKNGRPSLVCRDECERAGYHAISLTLANPEFEPDGRPVEGSGQLAPEVIAEKCVGCGLCQTRCYHVNVAGQRRGESGAAEPSEKPPLSASAIRMAAGPGREDRLVRGSAIELRRREQQERDSQRPGDSTEYLPD